MDCDSFQTPDSPGVWGEAGYWVWDVDHSMTDARQHTKYPSDLVHLAIKISSTLITHLHLQTLAVQCTNYVVVLCMRNSAWLSNSYCGPHICPHILPRHDTVLRYPAVARGPSLSSNDTAATGHVDTEQASGLCQHFPVMKQQ